MIFFFYFFSLGICRTGTKSCPNECNNKGKCSYISTNTGYPLTNCTLNDDLCTTKCTCDVGYNGLQCDTTDEEWNANKKIKALLIDSLSNQTISQDSDIPTIYYWINTANTLSANPLQLSHLAVSVIHGILTKIIDEVILLNVPYSGIEEMLTSIDDIIKAITAARTGTTFGNFVFDENELKLLGTLTPQAILEKYVRHVLSQMTSRQYDESFNYNNFKLLMTVAKVTDNIVTLSSPLSDYESVSGYIPNTFTLQTIENTDDVKMSLIVSKKLSLTPQVGKIVHSDPVTVILSDISVCGVAGCQMNISLETMDNVSYSHASLTNHTNIQYITECKVTQKPYEVTYDCPHNLTVTAYCNGSVSTEISICPYIIVEPTCGRMSLLGETKSDICTLVKVKDDTTSCVCSISSDIWSAESYDAISPTGSPSLSPVFLISNFEGIDNIDHNNDNIGSINYNKINRINDINNIIPHTQYEQHTHRELHRSYSHSMHNHPIQKYSTQSHSTQTNSEHDHSVEREREVSNSHTVQNVHSGSVQTDSIPRAQREETLQRDRELTPNAQRNSVRTEPVQRVPREFIENVQRESVRTEQVITHTGHRDLASGSAVTSGRLQIGTVSETKIVIPEAINPVVGAPNFSPVSVPTKSPIPTESQKNQSSGPSSRIIIIIASVVPICFLLCLVCLYRYKIRAGDEDKTLKQKLKKITSKADLRLHPIFEENDDSDNYHNINGNGGNNDRYNDDRYSNNNNYRNNRDSIPISDDRYGNDYNFGTDYRARRNSIDRYAYENRNLVDNIPVSNRNLMDLEDYEFDDKKSDNSDPDFLFPSSGLADSIIAQGLVGSAPERGRERGRVPVKGPSFWTSKSSDSTGNLTFKNRPTTTIFNNSGSKNNKNVKINSKARRGLNLLSSTEEEKELVNPLDLTGDEDVEIKRQPEQVTRMNLASLLGAELIDPSRNADTKYNYNRRSGTFSPQDTIPSPSAGDLLEEYLSGVDLDFTQGENNYGEGRDGKG